MANTNEEQIRRLEKLLQVAKEDRMEEVEGTLQEEWYKGKSFGLSLAIQIAYAEGKAQ